MKTAKTLTLGERFEKYVYENEISEDDWFKILNIVETYSGIMNAKDAAKFKNVSVQSIYQSKKCRSFLGMKIIKLNT